MLLYYINNLVYHFLAGNAYYHSKNNYLHAKLQLTYVVASIIKVCNNIGTCHCFDGYGPPDCKSPGSGGSLDSGPAASEDGTTPLKLLNTVKRLLISLLIVQVLFMHILYFTSVWKQKMKYYTSNKLLF